MPMGRGGKQEKSTPIAGHSKRMGSHAVKQRAQKRAEHRAMKAALKTRRHVMPPSA